jgi:CheY-like chemotaxis protein
MEATKEILEYEEDYNQVHVPIVALTANALKGDRERFLAAGLDEYTTKPLVRAEIVSLLNHFLADYIVESDAVTSVATQEVSSVVEESVPAFIEPVKAEEVEITPAFVEVETLEEEIVPAFIESEEVEIVAEFEETQNAVVEEEIAPVLVEEEKIEEPKTVHNDNVEQLVEEEKVALEYEADILLAKKSNFEAKLFTKILSSLGYTFDVANTTQELFEMAQSKVYKVVLFDKECQGLDLKEFSQTVKELSQSRDLLTSLILITETSIQEDMEDTQYIDETIKNIVNKDLLRLVVEKFIQGK